MMPCTRPAEPPVLAAGQAQWTANYCNRRTANPGAAFYWLDARDPMTATDRPLNQHILPMLLAMTDGHCAYCDGYPFGVTSSPTVDHFRPRSLAPTLAYAWGNLFPCCHTCQERNGKPNDWSPDLLKPDLSDTESSGFASFMAKRRYAAASPRTPQIPKIRHLALWLIRPRLSAIPYEYDFSRYFHYDPGTGRIEPAPEASADDQRRALETIRIFGLNVGGRPGHRRNYARRYRDADDEIRAYRFAFL